MMKKVTTIAVAVDFEEEVDDVLATAGQLARATNAELHVVHVYASEPEIMFTPPYAVPVVLEDPEQHEQALQAQRLKVRDMVHALSSDGVQAFGYMKPFHLGTAKSIREFVEEVEADLLVVGSHRRGRVGKVLLGSISEALVRKSRVPVLVVPRIDGSGE